MCFITPSFGKKKRELNVDAEIGTVCYHSCRVVNALYILPSVIHLLCAGCSVDSWPALTTNIFLLM